MIFSTVNDTISNYFKADVPLIVAHLIVALIIVIFFSIFLYGPLNKWLLKRAQYIKDVKIETEKLKNQMDLSKQKQEKNLIFSKEKIKNFESKSLKEITMKNQKDLLKSENYRRELIEQAKIDVDNYKLEAIDDTKKAIISNSILLSKKIIEKEINEKIHQKMIDEFIKSLDEK